MSGTDPAHPLPRQSEPVAYQVRVVLPFPPRPEGGTGWAARSYDRAVERLFRGEGFVYSVAGWKPTLLRNRTRIAVTVPITFTRALRYDRQVQRYVHNDALYAVEQAVRVAALEIGYLDSDSREDNSSMGINSWTIPFDTIEAKAKRIPTPTPDEPGDQKGGSDDVR